MIFVDREFLKIFVVLVGNVSIKNCAPSKLYECVAGRWGRMSSNSGRMLELEILWSWSVTRLSQQTSSSWRPLTLTPSATLRRPTLTERQISNRGSWCLESWIACYLWCVSFSEYYVPTILAILNSLSFYCTYIMYVCACVDIQYLVCIVHMYYNNAYLFSIQWNL